MDNFPGANCYVPDLSHLKYFTSISIEEVFKLSVSRNRNRKSAISNHAHAHTCTYMHA